MKRLILPLILVLLLAGTALAEQTPILLKNRTIDPDSAPVAWAQLSEHIGRHVLVQFDQTPNAIQRDDLAAEGLHLLVPVPHHAYLAYVESRDWAQMKSEAVLSYIGELEPEDKIHARVLDGMVENYSLAGNGQVDMLVYFFEDVSFDEMQALTDEIGAELLSEVEGLNAAFVRLDSLDDAYLLGGMDQVRWVSEPSPPWGFYNDEVRPVVGADTAHEPPYNVTGAGVNALVYDGGIVPRSNGDAKHPDLSGRLIAGGTGVPDIIGHATHVSCTVAGDGSLSDGQYAGMAPGASIITMDFTPSGAILFYNNPGDIHASYRKAVEELGAATANNSIGANIGPNGYNCAWLGDYEGSASLIDDIIHGQLAEPIIIVWAAGNERGSGCPGDFHIIPPPVPAKNTICVGATDVKDESIADFSSRGPTDDGRLRPDVTAPGHQTGGGWQNSGTKSCISSGQPGYTNMSGTSMASPVVTGATALIVEMWRNLNGGANPTPAMTKALIIHGAQDLGLPGPDYTFGYGGLRIPNTLDLILNENYLTLELDQGQMWTRKFRHTGTEDVKVTLVWTDPQGPILTARALVNDLDMEIDGPGNVNYLPWVLNPAQPAQAATTGVDTINPVEQVYIADAAAGAYEITIRATEVPSGPQAASLILTGLESCDVDGDGYDDEACGGDDCDDGKALVHPGVAEFCSDNVDNDCNGYVDEEDPACASTDDDVTDDDVTDDDNDDDAADDDDDDDDDDGCGW